MKIFPGSASSLVGGADILTAISPFRAHDHSKVLMSTSMPGRNGQAYLLAHPNPPLYFVQPPMRGQLYQLVNDSYVFQVHVQNTTETRTTSGDVEPAPLPYRVVFGEKQDDTVVDGAWTWTGTTLRWNHGSKHNHGLFYDCATDKTDKNKRGLFMDLKWIPTPRNCDMITLHSLGRYKVPS